jgi:hypothetical protein
VPILRSFKALDHFDVAHHIVSQSGEVAHYELVKQELALLVLHESCPSAEVGSLDLERGVLAHELDPPHELLEISIAENVDTVLEQFDYQACR